MAFLREIANVYRTQVAKDRFTAALLNVARDWRAEDPSTEDRQAFVTEVFVQYSRVTDLMLPVFMQNPSLQAKANELISGSLDPSIEAALDNDISFVVTSEMNLKYPPPV